MIMTKPYTVVALESGFADDCGARFTLENAVALAEEEAAARGVRCEIIGPSGERVATVAPDGVKVAL